MADKKKLIKIIIISIVFVALIGGLIALMILPQDYDTAHDKLGIGSPDSNFGTRLWIGVQVAILGLGTVFLMLVLLILMVTVMKFVFIGVGKLKEKRSASKSQAIESAPISAIEGPASDDDEEVVAVIMAALNAYYESQEMTYKSNLKFKVRSIKEIK